MTADDSQPTTGDEIASERQDQSGESATPRLRVSRRAVLGTSVLAVTGLAGCLGGGDGGNGEENGNGENLSDVPADLRLDGVALSSAFPVELFDPDTGEKISDIHYHENDDFQHWHQAPVEIPAGQQTPIAVRANSHDGSAVPLGEDGKLQVELEATDDTSGGFLDIDVNDNIVSLRGTDPGRGAYHVHLIRNGERAWTAPDPLAIRVVSSTA